MPKDTRPSLARALKRRDTSSLTRYKPRVTYDVGKRNLKKKLKRPRPAWGEGRAGFPGSTRVSAGAVCGRCVRAWAAGREVLHTEFLSRESHSREAS